MLLSPPLASLGLWTLDFGPKPLWTDQFEIPGHKILPPAASLILSQYRTMSKGHIGKQSLLSFKVWV